jgi:hypothetical protein
VEKLNSRESILKEIRKLNLNEQIKLMEELVFMLKKEVKKRSILELKGLGREVWEGIDIEEYIESERSSWNC